MIIGNPNELYHYGVLGMKWGVRRYQPYSTTGGRKSGKKGKEIGEAAKKNTTSKKQETREEILERAYKTGDAITINKYKNEVSDEYLRRAINRIGLQKKVSEFANEQELSERFNKKVSKYMNRVKTRTGWVNTGKDAYNTLASVYNATPNGRKNPLVKIKG